MSSLRRLGQLIDRTQLEHLRRHGHLETVRHLLQDSGQTGVERLGQIVDDVQDKHLAQQRHLARVRARLLASPRRAASQQRRRVILLAGMAAAAAATIAVALSVSVREGPLTFTTDDRPGAVGRWLTARSRELPIQFSDGSSIVLEPRSQTRVEHLDGQGANVKLRRGVARVHVVPRRTTRWRMTAGPFGVQVVGTRFRVAWNPSSEEFTLELTRGKVIVTGPLVDRRLIHAGQRLQVSVRRKQLRLQNGRRRQQPAVVKVAPQAPAGDSTLAPDAALSADAVVASSSPDVGTLPRPPLRRPKSRRNSSREQRPGTARRSKQAKLQQARTQPSTRAAPPWQLAQAGRFQQAMTAADRAGWSRILARANADQLAVLADAARLARRPSKAREIYLQIRRRFPGSSRAAAAAFSLGRLAFDEQRAFNAAVRWFGRYLLERPTGRLSREAAGRIIEAHHRAGSADAARTAARRYLARYPNGPHAAFSQRLLRKEPGR